MKKVHKMLKLRHFCPYKMTYTICGMKLSGKEVYNPERGLVSLYLFQKLSVRGKSQIHWLYIYISLYRLSSLCWLYFGHGDVNLWPFDFQTELHPGNLLRFTVGEGGLRFLDGKLEKADLQYLGKVNRARAFADSYSKVSWYMINVYLCYTLGVSIIKSNYQ